MMDKKPAALTSLTALLATSASGSIVSGSGAPLAVSASGIQNTFIGWDIDGVAGPELILRASASSSASTFDSAPAGTNFYGSAGFLSKTSGFAFVVDCSCGTLKRITSGYVVDSLAFTVPDASANGFGVVNSVVAPLAFTNIPQNQNSVIGFRFLNLGNIHYGIANITWDGSGSNDVSLTVNSWSYNSVPDQGITGAGLAIPEPTTFGLGLSGLAMGAAGLRHLRRRKS